MRPWERVQSLLRSPAILQRLMLRGNYSFEFDLMPVTVTGMSFRKRKNLVAAGANLFHRRSRPWSMPLHMQIEITNFCNLRCPVCPTGLNILERPPKAMDLGMLEDLMAEVGPYLLTNALFAWGEPLLHPRIADILRIATSYPAAVLVSTNGQNLVDPVVQDALLRFPPSYLIVAIDGLTDETNSRYRQGATLAGIEEGVRRLAEARSRRGQSAPILHMRFMVMNHNQHEVPLLQDFARSYGFDLLSTRSLSVIDYDEQGHRDMVPTAPEFRAYHYQNGTRLRRNDFLCMQPFWYPTVLADGTVVGCEQDFKGQEPMGILAPGRSFKQIWSSRSSRELRNRVRDETCDVGFCSSCPYADRDPAEANRCSLESWRLNPDILPAVL